MALQRARQTAPVPATVRVQLFDRSPLCTLALARYLQHPVGTVLQAEVERGVREQVYEREVLVVRPLGFVVATAARRISYEDSLAFQAAHEAVYSEYGFELRNRHLTGTLHRTGLAGLLGRQSRRQHHADWCPPVVLLIVRLPRQHEQCHGRQMAQLVVITGPIAAGKSNVASLIADGLTALGRLAVLVDVDDVATMVAAPGLLPRDCGSLRAGPTARWWGRGCRPR